MSPSRRFRFGVLNEHVVDGPTWVARARRAEDLGYATFLVRDHLGPDVFGRQLAPLAALATAAAVTRRLRVGTLVLSNDYRHPVILATETATLDLLSGGRLEVGLGAGWLRREYEQAGLPYDPPATRVARLEESIRLLKALWGPGPVTHDGIHYRVAALDGQPKPLRTPHPPLLIGAGSPRMLRLAGREADTVGLLTASTRTGTLLDDPAERLAGAVAAKIDHVRTGAGARFDRIELSLVAGVTLTEDWRGVAVALARQRGWAGLAPADVLAMPSVFLGPVARVVDEMEARRDRLGVSYYVVPDRDLEILAPVVARLAGR